MKTTVFMCKYGFDTFQVIKRVTAYLISLLSSPNYISHERLRRHLTLRWFHVTNISTNPQLVVCVGNRLPVSSTDIKLKSSSLRARISFTCAGGHI